MTGSDASDQAVPRACEVVDEVLAAVVDGDPERARLLLHPYLHWTEDGRTIRGRTKVLDLLARRARLAAPARVELRDGQIYSWFSDD